MYRESDERALNAIDANITQILLLAEQRCKRAHGHDWSPLLATPAGRTVIAAKWQLSNIMHGRSVIPYDVTREAAIISAKAQIQEAYGVLRAVQENATKIRETFLEDRATHIVYTRNGVTKAAALQQWISAERFSSMFKRLGIWFKGQ
jgi:hypothetical protein